MSVTFALVLREGGMDESSFGESPSVAYVGKLPPVPSYPAPLPPSLLEAPVWEGPEPVSDDEDDESSSETGEYETVQHEPLSEEKAMDSLKDMVRVAKKFCASEPFCVQF